MGKECQDLYNCPISWGEMPDSRGRSLVWRGGQIRSQFPGDALIPRKSGSPRISSISPLCECVRCDSAARCHASEIVASPLHLPQRPFLAETRVIIPALDEADCIAVTVNAWRRLGAGSVRVVDNGSRDRTSEKAERAGAEVVREPRRGYGAAAWRGMQDAPVGCRWFLFSSADGSDLLCPEDLVAWQQAVDEGADFVVGDRCTHPDSRQELKGTQRWGNAFACLLIHLGWGRRFRDLGSLRLCRRSVLEDLRLADRGFGWNVEMQVRALEAGATLVEIPVIYHPRMAGRSKISGNWMGILRAGAGILGITARLWLARPGNVLRSAEARPKSDPG